jgi:hypothetical protein
MVAQEASPEEKPITCWRSRWESQKGGESAERSQMALARLEESTVMPSAAKHLWAQRERPFAAAQGDTVGDAYGAQCIAPLLWTNGPHASFSPEWSFPGKVLLGNVSRETFPNFG